MHMARKSKKGKVLYVRVADKLHTTIRKDADREGREIQGQIRFILERYYAEKMGSVPAS
jgi:hypothetical protein